MTNKRLYGAGAALLLTLALSACGGGDTGVDNNGGQTANAGASDAFFQRVLALIGTSSDTAPPDAIDSIAVTTPETIEPAPL